VTFLFSIEVSDTYTAFWLERLNVDTTWKIISIGGRIILKWTLKNWDGMLWIGFMWASDWLVQHVNDSSSIKSVDSLGKSELTFNNVQCIYICQNMTIFIGSILNICYVRYKYMFWPWMLAIVRLYMKTWPSSGCT